MITLIWNFLLKKGFKYLAIIAIGVGLWFGAKWLFFKTWDKIAFANSKVEKVVLIIDTLQTDLRTSQIANDSLNDLNYECAKSFNEVTELNQKNIDSLRKANKILTAKNKELDSQINHFLEIAPCTEIEEVKDNNPFKKNKKIRVFVDCPEIEDN